MPRAIVTPSLVETLRSIRLQNKIQAKQLALHIGKSPAYVSKLENGSIQTIDTEELNSILQFISGQEAPVELAEQIYKSLKLKYTAKEIEEQFINLISKPYIKRVSILGGEPLADENLELTQMLISLILETTLEFLILRFI